jgi:hypothetical protein
MAVAFGRAAVATEGMKIVTARTAGTSFDIDRLLQRLLPVARGRFFGCSLFRESLLQREEES